MNSHHPIENQTERMLIIIAVMIASIMQVLDTTIVNVALPYMQGSLSTTADEITWILTSYLVASAIFMPLTGYFTDRFGQRNYLFVSLLGFTITSAACGISENITEIVFFRLLQGIFGAALVPLAQGILTDIFPREDRGKAMAIWGFAVMIAPILGPTLGGYLTEYISWRWTFYINVPFGIIALFLTWEVVPNTDKKERMMDWLGLFFISLAIGSLQYFLDRGNTQDWFKSWDIRIFAMLSIAGLLAFIIHNLFRPPKIVFDLRIFKDRNFTIATLLIAIMGLGMYGVMAIQPLMLEGVLNYPVLLAGLVMAPRGISGMLGMWIMGKYARYFDQRIPLTLGILLSIAGMYVYTKFSIEISPFWVIMPTLLQGLGVSLMFTALSTIAFSTLPSEYSVEAAGLFSLLRTLGASIGISLVVTIYTQHTQIAWNHLGGFINPYYLPFFEYVRHIHLEALNPLALQIINKLLTDQSSMVAFVDAFFFIMISFICMLPLVFLIKKCRLKKEPLIME